VSAHDLVTYRYDGSWEGLLCCVFESYTAHELPEAILGPEAPETSLFGSKTIVTDAGHAARVEVSLPQKLGHEAAELVRLTFFTCLPEKELWMLRFLRLGYQYGPQLLQFAGNDTVYRLQKAVQHLLSEAHLLKGFIRFSVQNNVLVTTIGPKNCVLPFLAGHFKARFPEEHWLIYDAAHHMALAYRPYETAILPLESFSAAPPDAEEAKFRALWCQFYDTIEIRSRHNERCRMTLMPKRYWKYMTEFTRDFAVPDANPQLTVT